MCSYFLLYNCKSFLFQIQQFIVNITRNKWESIDLMMDLIEERFAKLNHDIRECIHQCYLIKRHVSMWSDEMFINELVGLKQRFMKNLLKETGKLEDYKVVKLNNNYDNNNNDNIDKYIINKIENKDCINEDIYSIFHSQIEEMKNNFKLDRFNFEITNKTIECIFKKIGSY